MPQECVSLLLAMKKQTEGGKKPRKTVLVFKKKLDFMTCAEFWATGKRPNVIFGIPLIARLACGVSETLHSFMTCECFMVLLGSSLIFLQQLSMTLSVSIL